VRAPAALLGGWLGSTTARCIGGDAGLGLTGKKAATFIGAGPEAPLARTPSRGGGGAVYCRGHAASRMGFGRVCGWAERVGSGPRARPNPVGYVFFLLIF
jgi:hypothetical protein